MNQTDLDPDLDSGSKLGTATKAKDKAAPVGERKARIDAILKGGIDPHVHSGPFDCSARSRSPGAGSTDVRSGIRCCCDKGSRLCRGCDGCLDQKHHPELHTKIFSGIVLNNVVGGINPYAVEHTAAMGGKIVWMPTLAAENHLRWEKTANFAHPASTQKMRPASPVPVLDANKKVLDSVKEVLDIIAKTEMVLASGHLHVSETWVVFEEAQRRGVKRLIFTHPEDIVDASSERRARSGGYGRHGRALARLFPRRLQVQDAFRRRHAPADRGGRRRIRQYCARTSGRSGCSAPSRVFVVQSSSASISVTKMKTSIRWFPAMRLACSGLKPWFPPEAALDQVDPKSTDWARVMRVHEGQIYDWSIFFNQDYRGHSDYRRQCLDHLCSSRADVVRGRAEECCGECAHSSRSSGRGIGSIRRRIQPSSGATRF